MLSLAVVPVIPLAQAKLASGCAASCSQKPDREKDTDGCNKRECTVFACCYKLFFFIRSEHYTSPFTSETVAENNFGSNEVIFSYQLSDIWHPPNPA
jgi:hypothetical protein